VFAGTFPCYLPRIAELSLTSETDAVETWGNKGAFDISPTCLLWLFSGSNAFLEILSLSQFRQVTILPAAATRLHSVIPEAAEWNTVGQEKPSRRPQAAFF
jgi:hypothetical protein